MEKVFASVRFSSPLPVAVARTSQSPFPLAVIVLQPLSIKEKLRVFKILFKGNKIHFPKENKP